MGIKITRGIKIYAHFVLIPYEERPMEEEEDEDICLVWKCCNIR